MLDYVVVIEVNSFECFEEKNRKIIRSGRKKRWESVEDSSLFYSDPFYGPMCWK